MPEQEHDKEISCVKLAETVTYATASPRARFPRKIAWLCLGLLLLSVGWNTLSRITLIYIDTGGEKCSIKSDSITDVTARGKWLALPYGADANRLVGQDFNNCRFEEINYIYQSSVLATVRPSDAQKLCVKIWQNEHYWGLHVFHLKSTWK